MAPGQRPPKMSELPRVLGFVPTSLDFSKTNWSIQLEMV